MNIFKKKREIPEVLPDLAIEIPENSYPNKKKKRNSLRDFEDRVEETKEPERLNLKSETGFFKNILENVQDEIQDIDELENWYENKFKPGDIVSQMRDYWENQKPDVIVKNFGSNLKKELDEKIEKLHELEKDWKEIYIELIEKEQEIKEEEGSLKETLSEFVKLCKQHLSKKNPIISKKKTQKNK